MSFGGNIKQEKVAINGKSFTIQSWSVMKSGANLPKIGKAFAVPLGFIIGSMGDESALREAIPQAFYMLFEQLEEQDVMELFKLITSDVYTSDGVQLDIDNHLSSLDELFQLAAKCLHINYGCLIEGKGFKDLLGVMIPMHQMVAQA